MKIAKFVKKVVGTCLQIDNKDKVCIFSWKHTLDLAEAFALECQRVGAEVLLEVTTDELYYDVMLNEPEEYLRKTNPFSLALLDVATANIFVSGPENPERLKLISPDRMSVLTEGDKPYYDKFLEKKIRTANVHFGYVTPQRAKTYGFDYDKWKQNVQAALDVDYEKIRELGKEIAKKIENASVAHITAKNGTDLTLKLGDLSAHVHDGVLDDEDFRKGAVFTALPAGDVALALSTNAARGKFISNVPEADTGVLIRGITLDFQDGKLTSLCCGQNTEVLKDRYEKATGGKHQASWLAIGLNPEAEEGYLYNQIVSGSVSIGIGDNREFGGKIESTFSAHCTVVGPNLELDGLPIIKRGRFVA
jgi:leucyl aminopeptidase (aminopeptidase T)